MHAWLLCLASSINPVKPGNLPRFGRNFERTKTRENGAKETKEVQAPASQARSSAGISAATEARPTWYIGGDRSEAYLHCGAAAVIF